MDTQPDFEFETWLSIASMTKPEKHTLTEEELKAINAIDGVGMPSGSWDKRFRRDALAHAKYTREISDKAAAQLWRLFIRYRRQIPGMILMELMKIAEERAAPDFRKQQAALNEQAKIDEMKEEYERAMRS